jgi:hypothetical protein
MTAEEEPQVQDAAMSLCALGRLNAREHEAFKPGNCDQNIASPGDVATFHAHGDGSVTVDPADQADPSSLSSSLDYIHFDLSSSPPRTSDSSPIPTKKKAAPKKARAAAAKNSIKSKDPKRDSSASFDEMKRLMRVYGSLRCLRNRTPVDSGRTAKMESVKRKFYRWFPDLDERFVRTSEGWYKPRAGHEEEMRYRESKRKGDQDCLVKKRNLKRANANPNSPPV